MTEIDLAPIDGIDELLENMRRLIKKDPRLKGIHFQLFVNDNPMFIKTTKTIMLKPIGPTNMTAGMLDQYCPKGCGCRLKTDKNLYWCSGTFCDYIGKEETF